MKIIASLSLALGTVSCSPNAKMSPVSADNVPEIGVPGVATAPALDAPPTASGWKSATHFQLTPNRSTPQSLPPQRTHVLLLADQRHLLIRFICEDERVFNANRRADVSQVDGDVVEVFLDMRGDGTEWIEVQLSPDNIVFDQKTNLTAPAETQPDGTLKWDFIDRALVADPTFNIAGLRSATSRFVNDPTYGDGWIATLAIPLPKHDSVECSQTARANFVRFDHRQNDVVQMSEWVPVRHGCAHAYGTDPLHDATRLTSKLQGPRHRATTRYKWAT